VADFSIKSFDRLPSIQATLNTDLTTAIGVDFIMKSTQGNTIKVNRRHHRERRGWGRPVRLGGR
jgi:hypothetical protein